MNLFMNLWIVFVVIGGFGILRSELVYRFRMQRIRAISAANKRDLKRHDFYEVMDRRYAELEERGYFLMMLDLRRWTYQQFFPQEVS